MVILESIAELPEAVSEFPDQLRGRQSGVGDHLICVDGAMNVMEAAR